MKRSFSEVCVNPDMLLHASLESAEIVDLSSKHQVGQLSVRQEDNEEHDGKTNQVFGTAGHSAGQLTHGLIEVDELKKLGRREKLRNVRMSPTSVH